MQRLPLLLGSFAIVSGAALVVASSPAAAQAMRACAPRDALVQQLGQAFGEAVTAQGVDADGNLVQVFASQNGTWTIAVTLPGGPSCIVSSGENWNASQMAELPGPTPATR